MWPCSWRLLNALCWLREEKNWVAEATEEVAARTDRQVTEAISFSISIILIKLTTNGFRSYFFSFPVIEGIFLVIL
jgi:hypothetical protein